MRLALALVLACGSSSPHASAPPRATTAECPTDHAWGEVMPLRETTQPTLSGVSVGISNIFDRDVPDDRGKVSTKLSAQLSITDPTSQQTHRETVIAGSIVVLGADHYCVTRIEEGVTEPGSIAVREQR
jgi:hypothetical protein